MIKVSFVAPIYNYYPIVLHSLVCQTNSSWELILVHDGPNNDLYHEMRWVPQVTYIETDKRYNDWGHSLRPLGIDAIIESEYTVVTNADNYYAPQFIEFMTTELDKNNSFQGSYCDFINNLYFTESRLEIGFVDCGNFLTKTENAKTVGWTGREFAADWKYVDEVITKYGKENFIKIPRTLFVHN